MTPTSDGPPDRTPLPSLVASLYAAFNRRDMEAALALMTDTVSWPRASEGGRVVGKDEIRAYWTRQWSHFDPHVEPLDVIDRPTGPAAASQTHVRVRQIVRDHAGNLLSDSEVWHVFTLAHGLVQRMDIPGADDAPSSAFSTPARP